MLPYGLTVIVIPPGQPIHFLLYLRKTIFMKKALPLLLLLFSFHRVHSQTTDDILNLLVAQKTITQKQADSIKAENASKKSFVVKAFNQMTLSGYTQVRYQAFEQASKKSGFDIRRARLDLKGQITKVITYRLQTDLAVNPKLLDAYGEFKIKPWFVVTAGQQTVPFSAEGTASSGKLDLIDRSQVVEALGGYSKDVIGNQNGRDIGIQASGVLVRSGGRDVIQYFVGVFNGQGINIPDTANEAKDLAGRLLFSPVKGLMMGVSGYNGWAGVLKPDEPGKSQVRDRFGVEAKYSAKRLNLQAEYIQGQDGKTHRNGGYIQASWFLVPEKLQLAGKYDIYDADKTKENTSTAYVLGANWVFSPFARLQAFYSIAREEGPQVANDFFAMQLQVGF
jgi:phosphate-selective porin OprO and OprP